MPNLSPEFIEVMRALLGPETDAFLRALDAPAALALRVHRRGEAAMPFIAGAVPWAEGGFYLRPETRPGTSIAHWAGAFYLQEASAMLPAAVLAARPGERVLDLCAAPGGKASQIARAMDGEGALVANEVDPARARVLAGNLERLGVCNAVVTCEKPDRLAAKWSGFFDAVLVDAPCSGEGMFRRDLDARKQWSAAAPAGCQKRQADILDAAARLVRPGGRLVYSTCTFNALENEESVRDFLCRHPDFSLWDFEMPGLGASEGGMLRIWPQRVRGDGQFAARLRRAGGEMEDTPIRIAERERGAQLTTPCTARFAEDSWKKGARARRGARCPQAGKGERAATGAEDGRALVEALHDTVLRSLPPAVLRARMRLLGDRLFAVPALAPDMDGLRVVSPGTALLRVGKNRVEPEHALAMALCPEQALRAAALDEAEARAFLAGEVLPRAGEAGWALATYDGLALGWGKQADGTLKNHLPKGLRKTLRA